MELKSETEHISRKDRAKANSKGNKKGPYKRWRDVTVCVLVSHSKERHRDSHHSRSQKIIFSCSELAVTEAKNFAQMLPIIYQEFLSFSWQIIPTKLDKIKQQVISIESTKSDISQISNTIYCLKIFIKSVFEIQP